MNVLPSLGGLMASLRSGLKGTALDPDEKILFLQKLADTEEVRLIVPYIVLHYKTFRSPKTHN